MVVLGVRTGLKYSREVGDSSGEKRLMYISDVRTANRHR